MGSSYARGGPTHVYLGASPECWALYGELLAREYGNPDYFSAHQLTVDTYAVQHPGKRDRRTVRSLALHLITLCLMLERGLDPGEGPRVHKHLTAHTFEWLDPPESRGGTTVADALGARGATEHQRAIRAWAREVWAAWEPHHRTIRRWADDAFAPS